MPALLALTCLLALAAPSAAGSEWSGRVRYADGAPAAGARLLFFDLENLRLLAAVLADEQGRFSAPLAAPFRLGRNYPNPFNPTTAIPFYLEREAHLRLDIFDVLGQRLRVLADGHYPAGEHRILWDGLDERGQAVAAGLYFYRLESESGERESGRMVLVDGPPAPAVAPAPAPVSTRRYAATIYGPGMATAVFAALEASAVPLELEVERAPARAKAAQAGARLLGDVNGDGRINISDALIIATYGIDPSIALPAGGDISLGDVNGDGRINISDALMVATYGIDPLNPALPPGLGQPVSRPNSPPLLAPIGTKTASPGARLDIAVSAIDPDGDAVSLSVEGAPPDARLQDGRFTWTPAEQGTYRLAFVAEDGRGGRAREEVEIRVRPLRVRLIRHLVDEQTPSFVNILFQATDDSGRGIPFLSRENFELLEDDRPISPTESAMQIRKKDTLPYTLKTVLVFDNSASLAAHLEQVRAAAIALVRGIVPQQLIAVYKFSDRPVLVQDFTNETASLVRAIESIEPEFATTDLYGAVVQGLSRWEDIYSVSEVQQGFLVLLTDGSDTQNSTTLNQALLARGNKQIYTLGLGSESEPEVLARLGNAGYFPVEDAGDLASRFAQIQSSIALTADSFYWLNYLSPKRGDRDHTLLLKVRGNTLSGALSGVFNSAGFYSVLPGLYINADREHIEGIDTLHLFENDTVLLDAVSYFAAHPPRYSWTSTHSAAVSVEANISEKSRAFVTARGDSGQSALVQVEDIANQFRRSLLVLVTRVPFPLEGLIAYYPFSGNAQDRSGRLQHAIARGAILTTDRFERANAAYRFDGINDYLEVEIDVSEINYTASLWFRTTAPDGGLFSIDDGVLGSGGNDRHLFLQNGRVRARLFNSSEILSTTRDYADGQWHHVVHVFGGAIGGQRLYIDGDVRAIGTRTFSEFDRQTGANIGYSDFSDPRFFAGAIDDVRLYNRALSEAEIRKLFNDVPRGD